ncbi:hypothetical protein CWO90_06565 [Bradyrhizobium sp. Leo121]|nr:hypothetical protein CWO90_06565 [Bradyrhizobium sp. Leo121]
MSDISGAQSELTIACIQMEPIVGAKQANVAKSLEWSGQAALNSVRPSSSLSSRTPVTFFATGTKLRTRRTLKGKQVLLRILDLIRHRDLLTVASEQ